MRLLLTAFEPFDGTGLNSSLEAARAFLATGPGADLVFALLPVRYDEDTRRVEDAIATFRPDTILHLGQGRGGAVRVERIAVNVRYERSEFDAIGPRAAQRLIDPCGPAAYFATVPVEGLAAAIEAAGVPACVSNHAGIYLCNHVFYRSLARAEQTGGRVGFLHLPPLPEQRPPSHAGDEAPLPCEMLAAAVAAAVAALAEA